MQKNRLDFVSYPYLGEKKLTATHELMCDRLCSELGLAYAKSQSQCPEISEDILFVIEAVYHINGSIRGKLAISELDLDRLYERFLFYKEYAKPIIKGFVLPIGCETASLLHLARCQSKEVVRNMHMIRHEGLEVAQILFDYVNLNANYCFVLAVYANSKNGHSETPFISKSF